MSARWLPYPLLSGMLAVVWMVLNQSVAPGTIVMGAMLALAVVFFMEQFDRRVRSPDDLAITEVPLLAQLNEWQPAHSLLGRPKGRGWALPAPG